MKTAPPRAKVAHTDNLTTSTRSAWDATKTPKPSLSHLREPREPTVAPTPNSNAPESFHIPSEPSVLLPRCHYPQRPFPTPGDILVMGSHVLQHLDRGETALHSTAESPGGLGSPYRPVQHNPGSGGRPGAFAFQATTLPPGWHESGLLRCFLESSRQLGALRRRRTARKWRRPQQRQASKGGTDSSHPRKAPDPRHRRQYCLLLVCKDPLFLLGPSGADEVPFRSRWRRMNTEKWFKEPPPPSLKSS